MEVVNNYKNYRKYLPEYSEWKEKQDIQREKRLEYLKQNPDKMNAEDIQRGKILLHSIDVMDEYSQSNAEDMEVATEFAVSQVVGIVTLIGMLGGSLLSQTKGVQKLLTRLSNNNTKLQVFMDIVPSVMGLFVGTAASFPAIMWATKAKVSASRKGRFEAMNQDLKNPAIFAVLTPEQQKLAQEKAKDIVLDDKDKKRIEKTKKMGLGNPFTAFKTLKKFIKEDSVYNDRKAEFNKQLKESEKHFASELTDKQIQDAKRDQQILSDMVQKMDIASQDYAENTELATNTLTTLSLAGGGLVGWASNKLMNVLKVKGGIVAKVLPWAVGASIPLAMGIYAAKVQKHASRIGRFKVRQEMLNNPATLVYVDDKNADTISDIKSVEKTKKPNIFKFFIQLIKDNKEYNNYLKNEGMNDLKLHKAVEQLELSEEQIRKAKALQMNVFKTFNKVDDKSQTYSESVEAMGEMTKQGVSLFGSIAVMGYSIFSAFKFIENPELIKNQNFSKLFAKMFSPVVLLILPVIGLDIYVTKAQKKASRVADMLALKDLEDHRHYVDYTETSNNKAEKKIEKTADSNLLARFNK